MQLATARHVAATSQLTPVQPASQWQVALFRQVPWSEQLCRSFMHTTRMVHAGPAQPSVQRHDPEPSVAQTPWLAEPAPHAAWHDAVAHAESPQPGRQAHVPLTQTPFPEHAAGEHVEL